MPALTEHPSRSYRKLLVIGDSKVGKTSSLVSLVEAGYDLRILNMDNLLDPLVSFITKRCPDRLGSVEYRTLRDQYRMTEAGPVLAGKPRAFVTAIKMLDHWAYDGTDLGVPAQWGHKAVLVIDSLSRFCDAAFDWAESMVPRGKSGEYDRRAVYGNAQSVTESILAALTSDSYETNIIVICHGQYMEMDTGAARIFPQGIGQKLSPKIPQYFPAYVQYVNKGGTRTIQLKSNPMIDLANPDPANLPDTLPAETGLATIFGRPQEAQPKLTLPTTVRRLHK